MKKIEEKIKLLSEIEWTTCWMSIRYACGRQTIASSMLPKEVIKSYYYRMTQQQKSMIARDIRNSLENYPDYNKYDLLNWAKFCNAMDYEKHWEVKLKEKVNGINICKVFDTREFTGSDRIYPLEEYLKRPFIETYIDRKDIISGL